jgi:hypothetical protein
VSVVAGRFSTAFAADFDFVVDVRLVAAPEDDFFGLFFVSVCFVSLTIAVSPYLYKCLVDETSASVLHAEFTGRMFGTSSHEPLP